MAILALGMLSAWPAAPVQHNRAAPSSTDLATFGGGLSRENFS